MSSKLLENKQAIHIASEIVALIGLTIYFSSKNKKLMGHIEELAQRLEEQDDQIKKHEQMISQLGGAMNNLLQKQSALEEKHQQVAPQPLSRHAPPRRQKPRPRQRAPRQEESVPRAPRRRQAPQTQPVEPVEAFQKHSRESVESFQQPHHEQPHHEQPHHEQPHHEQPHHEQPHHEYEEQEDEERRTLIQFNDNDEIEELLEDEGSASGSDLDDAIAEELAELTQEENE